MATFVAQHPLVQCKLGRLRSIKTDMAQFRNIANELSALLAYEAARDIVTKVVTVDSWQGKVEIQALDNQQLTVIPILRAGLGMADGVLKLMPTARMGIIGLFRNEETLQAVEYFKKLPPDMRHGRAFILDPMLATGGTLLAAIRILKDCGCQKISSINFVCAPEGLAKVENAHPDVDIYTAAVDERLNDKGYILPGLGDAGDRIFGTE